MSDDGQSARFVVADVTPEDRAGLAEFYRKVLVPNFGADELEAEETLAEGVAGGGTRAVVARDPDGGGILGGAVWDRFEAANMLLLSYIATTPRARSGGIGTALLKAGLDGWAPHPPPSLVVAEVEDPRHHHDTTHGDPAARLRFYERQGARCLDLPYFQPALQPDKSRVTALLLMVLGGTAVAPDTCRVPAEPLRRFVTEYLEVCEGPVQPADTQARRLLDACSEPTGVPLLDVGVLPAPTG